jgi:hypothetical protein
VKGNIFDALPSVIAQGANTFFPRVAGISRTSEAFEYGIGLARRLKDREELGLGVREKLHELERRLGNAFAVYRTGGLFSSFSGLKADLNADQLWLEGVRQVEQAEAAASQARLAG